MKPNLKTIRVIGCDKDEALFPRRSKLLCSSHKKDNIERKFRTHFRARYMAINHLLLGIHGKDTGCVHEKGLQKTDGPKGIM